MVLAPRKHLLLVKSNWQHTWGSGPHEYSTAYDKNGIMWHEMSVDPLSSANKGNRLSVSRCRLHPPNLKGTGGSCRENREKRGHLH